MLIVRLLNVWKQWKTNLVLIIYTKRTKNLEFHMIRLTEIFLVKNLKFALITLMTLSINMGY